MTPKIDSTTAAVVLRTDLRRAALRGEPLATRNQPDREREERCLGESSQENRSADRVGGRHDVGARRHVRQGGRGDQSPDQREHVADPGEHRNREHQRQAPRHHQPSHRIESHGAQRVDLLRHLHRRHLRREAGTRSPGDDNRGDQRAQLAEMRDDDELRHIDGGAKSSELRHAEEADDQARRAGSRRRRPAVRRRRSAAAVAATSANPPSVAPLPRVAPRWRRDR